MKDSKVTTPMYTGRAVSKGNNEVTINKNNTLAIETQESGDSHPESASSTVRTGMRLTRLEEYDDFMLP